MGPVNHSGYVPESGQEDAPVYAVVMAGGRGTRFWPRSRKRLPKQLLNIVSDKTLIQETMARLEGLVDAAHTLIVTDSAMVPALTEQVTSIPPENIVVEPQGLSTAPCLALAATVIERRDRDAVMMAVPADHYVRDDRGFQQIMRLGAKAALRDNYAVTIGIRPTRPETGFGYISIGSEVLTIDGHPIFRVRGFTEKPSLPVAREFVSSGRCLWNSGIFIWRLETFYGMIEAFLPDVHERFEQLRGFPEGPEFDENLKRTYSELTPISVDYGIMEKAANSVVLPAQFGWNDVGTWASLREVWSQDQHGNVSRGDFIGVEARSCVVDGERRAVVVLGLDGVVVVDTDDAVLVCSLDSSQQVREVVERLEREQREDLL